MKKIILTLAILLSGVLAVNAKTEKQPTYLYGFASSFNDSTVYLIEVQLVEDAWIDSKTKFLYGRDNYSYQLRDYLRNQGCKTPTCMTGFANTKKKAEEKYLKLRGKYLAKGNYNIKYISENDFKYKAIAFEENAEATLAPTKQKANKKKKKEKAAK